MTNVDRRIYDELARVLKNHKVGNALIMEIADVCARSNPNFKRDWFLSSAGYEHLTSKSKVLKLGNKMRVIPASQVERADLYGIAAGNAPENNTPAHLATDITPVAPKGWDQIEPGPEQSFAPPTRVLTSGEAIERAFAPPTKEE